MCGRCVVVCEDFEIFQNSPVCGLCAVVCEDFESFQSSPVCGPCAVVCGDFVQYTPPQGFAFWDPNLKVARFLIFPVLGTFEFSLKNPIGIFPLCVGAVLLCVGTLSFFKAPLCVVHVLRCVETLSFSKFPVCVGPCVVVGDFVFSSPPVCDHLVNLCIV